MTNGNVSVDQSERPVRHYHIPELQSVRGLAATVVLVHHCTFYFQEDARFHFASEALLNAHAAVMIFFSLSGYVLTRSLIGRGMNTTAWMQFYIARFFRIYPALWIAASIELTIKATGAARSLPGASAWFAHQDIALHTKQVIGTLGGVSARLLPPMWSVSVELLASLLLPGLAYAVHRGWRWWAIVQLILLAIAFTFRDSEYLSNLWAFGLGAAIPLVSGQLADASRTSKSLWVIAALITLMFFRLLNPAWRFELDYFATIPTLIESIAAAFLLAAITTAPKMFPFLANKRLVRLGDYSYSLYLLHWPIMSIFAGLMLSRMGFGLRDHGAFAALVLIFIVFPITYFLSALMYEYVELPGIALGKTAIRVLSDQTHPSLSRRG